MKITSYAVKNNKDACLVVTNEYKNWCVFDEKDQAESFLSSVPTKQKEHLEVIPVNVRIETEKTITIDDLIYWLSNEVDRAKEPIECEDGNANFVSVGAFNSAISRMKRAIYDQEYAKHITSSLYLGK